MKLNLVLAINELFDSWGSTNSISWCYKKKNWQEQVFETLVRQFNLRLIKFL